MEPLLILLQKILRHLNINQILLVVLLQMKQIEKKEGVKIVVPLKYLSNFWRSSEMPLINCKVEFSLRWFIVVYCLVQELMQLLQ